MATFLRYVLLKLFFMIGCEKVHIIKGICNYRKTIVQWTKNSILYVPSTKFIQLFQFYFLFYMFLQQNSYKLFNSNSYIYCMFLQQNSEHNFNKIHKLFNFILYVPSTKFSNSHNFSALFPILFICTFESFVCAQVAGSPLDRLIGDLLSSERGVLSAASQSLA